MILLTGPFPDQVPNYFGNPRAESGPIYGIGYQWLSWHTHLFLTFPVTFESLRNWYNINLFLSWLPHQCYRFFATSCLRDCLFAQWIHRSAWGRKEYRFLSFWYIIRDILGYISRASKAMGIISKELESL